MAAHVQPPPYKLLPVYALVLLVFGAGTVAVLQLGTRLNADRQAAVSDEAATRAEPAPSAQKAAPAPQGFGKILRENLRHPLSVLLLQVVVILLAARGGGALFRRAGQPTVVGEMVAGILLGPSLLGVVSPGAISFLFPPASLETLRLLSQAGIILFMFTVGMELNFQHLRRQAHAAVLVSHASIVVPFFLGAAFSLVLYRSYAPGHVSFTAFGLFMAVAMSITAFPVLARVISERGLSKSHLGSTAIACAAVDDATAWCLLAVVVTLARAEGLGGALFTIILALVFICAMLFLLKPAAERLFRGVSGAESWGKGAIAAVLAFVFLSALLTEVIGIHALFGAFLAGVVMPPSPALRSYLTRQLEPLTTAFLLPLFFAFTGLRTQVGLLDDWASWLMCAGVVAIAVTGKLGGSAAAARWTGMGGRDSLALGALMNTRGLMELIVLNIGYDMGILSPTVFSMMILMALITTFMTGPLLSLLGVEKPGEGQAEGAHQ